MLLPDRLKKVILDMILPDMGGGEIFDCMKAFNPDARIILSSGYNRTRQAEHIMYRGRSSFLQKPCQIEDIPGKIREVLDA